MVVNGYSDMCEYNVAIYATHYVSTSPQKHEQFAGALRSINYFSFPFERLAHFLLGFPCARIRLGETRSRVSVSSTA